MARWSSMSTPEKIKLLEQRLETIKACQKLLYEFEQMTVLKIEALEEEMPRSK